jgi:hypothetical protein
MELRNRNVAGRGDVPASLRDVALGPTIYGGERYSKMSERLKRQHKKPEDAVSTTKVSLPLGSWLGAALGLTPSGYSRADCMGTRCAQIVAPRLIGLGFALFLVLSYVFYLQYLAAVRRRDRSQ